MNILGIDTVQNVVDMSAREIYIDRYFCNEKKKHNLLIWALIQFCLSQQKIELNIRFVI